ncbi:hypothetical protein [Streptomyces sp. RLB3-17]|uniref:hypothetical protein n=1 Tax=Streptomyces sp. RLB3-17 TaxID=2594455 RepID=UPI0013DE858F|nr:hypothetical protein [Streptomyces sp. RLB3-17]
MHDVVHVKPVCPSPGRTTVRAVRRGMPSFGKGPVPVPPQSGVAPSLVAAAMGLCNAWGPYEQTGVTVGHVIVLAIAPVCLTVAWRWRMARWNVILVCFWLLASAFTEIMADDSVHDAILALSRPFSVLVSFCGAMWALQRTRSVVRVYGVTFVAGLILNVYIFLRSNPSVDSWKYGYGPVVSLAVVLLAFVLLGRQKRSAAVLLVISMALVNLFQGFRSEFLIVCVAGAVTLLAGRRGPRSDWKRVVPVVVGLISLAVVVPNAYGYLASSGRLGIEQQYRWERQSRVDGGVLVGARPEIAASYVIVKESPIVGRGFTPEVSYRTRSEFLGKLQAGDVDFNERRENYYFGRGLYLHSVLFQLWTETGMAVIPGILLPVLFVLLALVAAVREGSRPYALLFAFLCSQLAWDLLFSPWPRLEGLYLGTAAAAAVLYLGSWSRSGPASAA